MKQVLARIVLSSVILILLALASACMEGGEGVEPIALELPQASSVARVQIPTQDRTSKTIAEPEGIILALEALASLRFSWEETTEPLPTTLHSFSMSAADNTILLVVWIGEDWIAANDMQKKPNFRQSLVEPERGQLLRSLGLE